MLTRDVLCSLIRQGYFNSISSFWLNKIISWHYLCCKWETSKILYHIILVCIRGMVHWVVTLEAPVSCWTNRTITGWKKRSWRTPMERACITWKRGYYILSKLFNIGSKAFWSTMVRAKNNGLPLDNVWSNLCLACRFDQ